MNQSSEHFFQVEKEWAKLSARILNENLIQRCILLGMPSSFRDPESNKYYHNKTKLISPLYFFYQYFKSGLRLLLIILFKKFGMFRLYSSNQSRHLTISPSLLVTSSGNRVETTYLTNKDATNCDWLIFSEGSRQGNPIVKITRIEILKIALQTIILFLRQKPDNIHQKIAIKYNLLWAMGGHWVHLYSLEKILQYLFDKDIYGHVHCLHEFHPHARVLWKIARKYNISSSSILHAPMEREKLWLFPSEIEKKAGLCLPSILFLYHSSDYKLLSAEITLDDVNIKFCCGPRFTYLQKLHLSETGENNALLFVSSIALWDNHTVLKALFLIANKNLNTPVVFRPHPNAIISWQDRLQLKKLVKSGAVKLNNNKLINAIENSRLIIGMCSSVLDEALFLGKPAVNLLSNDYQSLGSSLAFRINVDYFSIEVINKIENEYKFNCEKLREAASEKFGLGLNQAYIFGGINEQRDNCSNPR